MKFLNFAMTWQFHDVVVNQVRNFLTALWIRRAAKLEIREFRNFRGSVNNCTEGESHNSRRKISGEKKKFFNRGELMRTQIRVLSFWWIPVFSRRVVCLRIPVFSPCVIPFFIVCRDTSTVFFKMLPQIWDGRSATVIHIWRGKVGYNWITVLLIYWKKGTRRVDQILRLRATPHTIHLRA